MKLKKQVRIIIEVTFVIIIILGIFLFIENKPKKSNYTQKKEEDFEDAAKNYATKVYAEEMSKKIEGEDGWYYYFLITTVDKNQKETSNFFNGCNLKYNRLDNYKLQVYKDETYTEVVNEYYSFPTLSVSKKETNGIRANDEITMIENWFDKKQFNKEISLGDMNDIDIYNFDKKVIINLYNNAQLKQFDKNIGPYLMDPCSIKNDDMRDGYQWNIGIFAFRGHLIALRIDVKYSDGTFLSDLVSSDKATLTQKNLYDSFEKIENYIIENQKIDVKDKFPQYSTNEYERLFNIIETFDDGYDDE